MTYQYEEISPERARELLALYVSPQEWQEAVDFMRKMYGDQAYKLDVSVDLGEAYDDEHEYYTSGEVTCVARDGTMLSMDMAYCREITQTLRDEEEGVDEEHVREAIFSYEQPLLPMRNASYIIDQPPATLPVFAIRKEQ
jgi:hypothetical protein